MAKDVRINVRVPEYMKEKVQKDAESKNISISDLVRFILVEYYAGK